ncbi:hypothetical protein C2S51_015770 [Perilla frutescens var. frutescens]|nr:hypothetical protein C2S51_015770 [Perilla frutescens var. frutescens]
MHEQPISMFGCAFLIDEKIDTFEWLFKVFKESMKLKCPVTIFTNQDLAITNALSKVFPDAKHRLCIWNLYQNAVSRFGRLKGNKAFNDAFQRCLTGCVNKEEFERCWASMVSVHGLEGNTWFARLYDLRENGVQQERSKKIFEAIEALTITETLIQDTDVSSSCISVLDPPKTTTKGRKKRIKGQPEKNRKKKTSDAANSIELDEFGSKTPNPRLF